MINAKMIKARNGYGLSCVDMGRVCGFGANQWRLYESGKATPNKSNSIIINTVLTPIGMMNYLNLVPAHTRKKMGKDFDKVCGIVDKIVRNFNKTSEAIVSHLNENYFN